MRNINFHHNALTAAEITTRRLCKLHRVTLFAPAICRVNRGSKVIEYLEGFGKQALYLV